MLGVDPQSRFRGGFSKPALVITLRFFFFTLFPPFLEEISGGNNVKISFLVFFVWCSDLQYPAFRMTNLNVNLKKKYS